MTIHNNHKLLHVLLEPALIEYLVKKNLPHTREETLQQAEECLRYLYLSHHKHGNIPVNAKVDTIWHFLILETRAYFDLCTKLPAKEYKHHRSLIYQDLKNPENEKPTVEHEALRHLEWLVSYVTNFGDFTEESLEYWPYASALMQTLQVDLPALNQKLKELKMNFQHENV